MGGNDEICVICGLTPAVVSAFKRDFFHCHAKWRVDDHDAKTVALAQPSTEGGPLSWCPIDVSAHEYFHNNLAVVGHFNHASYDDYDRDGYDKNTDGADWPDLLKADTVSLICGLKHEEGGPLRSIFSSEKHKAFRIPGGEVNSSNLDEASNRGWPSEGRHGWQARFSYGALMVHVPCWELLQGVVQWRRRAIGPTPAMTPVRFWRTELSAGLAKAKERHAGRSFWGFRDEEPADSSPEHWKKYDVVERYVWHGFCDAWIFLHEATANHEFEPHVAAAINDSIDGKGINLAVREDVWERLPAWVWQPPYL